LESSSEYVCSVDFNENDNNPRWRRKDKTLVEEFIEERESCVYFIFLVYFSFNLDEPSRAMIVIREIPTTALAMKDCFRGVYTAALGKEGGGSSSFGASAASVKVGEKHFVNDAGFQILPIGCTQPIRCDGPIRTS
jgi:hypothetical protein